jgi:hypothetical protein
MQGLLHGDADSRRPLRLPDFFAATRVECPFISIEKRFHHAGGGYAWQICASCGRCERQTEAHQVVGGVADYGLVEVPNLDGDSPMLIGHRSEIANVTITTDPDGRTLGQVPDELLDLAHG